jgi:malate dehydrogenase (oxaloacetate-decarboxylating)(NADP+)
VCDSKGVIYEGARTKTWSPPRRATPSIPMPHPGRCDRGADVFLGCPPPVCSTGEMVASAWRSKPLIFALANPVPEILPSEAKAVRPDCIIATGRSDFPNQVNNVLCFPFIFRGALDVGATQDHRGDEARLCESDRRTGRRPSSPTSSPMAYGGENLAFGPELPHSEAVRPAPDRQDRPGGGQGGDRFWGGRASDRRLGRLPPEPQQVRLPVRHHHEAGIRQGQGAPAAQKRVLYAEGESERVLRAVRVAVDEGLARPHLIGRPSVIGMRIQKRRPQPCTRAGFRHHQCRIRSAATANCGRTITS